MKIPVELLAKINLGLFYALCIVGVLMGNVYADIACVVCSNIITHVYKEWEYND